MGNINTSDLDINNQDVKFMSISPKFISIEKSNNGNAIVVSREFLGEYLIYKISINKETLRVRTNINNILKLGDKCIIKMNKDSFYFLFPGAHKIYF